MNREADPAARFRLEGVEVSYGPTRALAGVDLEVDAGEAIALVGPSGAGKTTLLRLLNGSLGATAGHVAVDGRDLAELSPRELRRVRASIGFVHQELHLVPNLRVVKNVLAGRLGRWSLPTSLAAMLFPSRRLRHEVHEILERVGIGEKLYQRTDRLSGGQRQRVAVARALFQRPRALLADEPVSAVDPARARDLVELLLDVARERRLTLVVSLHNLELARRYFPRLVGVRDGRVVFDRVPGELGDAAFDALFALDGRGWAEPEPGRPGGLGEPEPATPSVPTEAQ